MIQANSITQRRWHISFTTESSKLMQDIRQEKQIITAHPKEKGNLKQL